MIPVLETSRLILRGFRAEDYPAHAAIWADPRTTAKFGAYAFDDENCWLRFQRNWGQWAIFGHGFWALQDRGSGAYIGAMGFFNARRNLDIPYRDAPEAGWVLNPDHHGQGLASEALAAIFAWGDIHLDAPRTWCMIAPQNLISQKTAARFGFHPGLDASYHGERVLTFVRERENLSLKRAQP